MLEKLIEFDKKPSLGLLSSFEEPEDLESYLVDLITN